MSRMIIYDLAFVFGIGSLAYGAYQWHPAAAWVIAGIALCIFGVGGAAKVKGNRL